MPTDGGLALHQGDRVARVSQLQRGLDAGDATANHQRARVNRHAMRLQRLLASHPVHGASHQRLRLLRRRRGVQGDPGALLPDVGHLHQVRIEAGAAAGPPEGRLVQLGRAGGHDDPGQTQLLNILLDELLARLGAHEPVMPADGYSRERCREPGDAFHIDRVGDVGPTVAHVDADLLSHSAALHPAHR